jgi:hypothetical protein
MNFVTHTHALLRIHTVKPTTATAKLAQKRRALQAQSGVDKVTNMLSSLSVQDAPTHTHTEPVASDQKDSLKKTRRQLKASRSGFPRRGNCLHSMQTHLLSSKSKKSRFVVDCVYECM